MNYIGDYEPKVINEFKGLFTRGPAELCPSDHAAAIQNMVFTRTGAAEVRGRLQSSLNVGHACVNIFLSTISDGNYYLLSCDGAGNIYSGASVIFSQANLVDFACINIFNKTVIAPIYSASGVNQVLLIWDGTTVRPLGGAAITSTFTATEGAAGSVDIGTHKYAIVYETSSGFTSPPGPVIASVFTPVSLVSTGGKKVDLSSIPLGPTGTVARRILVTKANSELFYEVTGGRIADNVTTTLTLDWLDTDLAVSADYLFDILPSVPAGYGGLGSMSLQKFHERLFVIGAEGDLIRVSNVGDCESFSDVTGYIQVPAERDGNSVRAGIPYFDVLYLTKAVGVFSTTDNGSDDPSTWSVVPIEGALGAYPGAIGTITESQVALTTKAAIVFACRTGVFLFKGAPAPMPISYKIDKLWQTLTPGYENRITLAMDPFLEVFYILCCTDGATSPNKILMCDFADGLEPNSVKWSVFSFAVTPTAIGMVNFNDGSDFQYYLRITAGTTMYKYTPLSKGTDVGSVAVNAYYQSYVCQAPSVGMLAVYAFVRLSVTGSGTLNITFYDKDGNLLTGSRTITMSSSPGRNYDKRINYIKEGIMVRCGVNSGTDQFTLIREDILRKDWYSARVD